MAAEVERQEIPGRDQARSNLALRGRFQARVTGGRIGGAGLAEQGGLPVRVRIDQAEANERLRAASRVLRSRAPRRAEADAPLFPRFSSEAPAR